MNHDTDPSTADPFGPADPPREAAEFCAALFVPGDVLELRTMAALGGDVKQEWFTDPATVAAAAIVAGSRGRNAYVGANPRATAGAGGNAGVALARSIFVDLDPVHLAPATTPEAMLAEARRRVADACLPEASIVVWSGHGVHLYWLLWPVADDLLLWSRVMRDLIATLKSDPAVKDAARIMRVPGTMNRKPPEAMARLIECHADRRYALDDLAVCVWHANAAPERGVDLAAVAAAIDGRPSQRKANAKGASVIDAFNAATPLADLLTGYGYDVVAGGRFYRPGKPRGGQASGIIRAPRGVDASAHFSTNDPLNDLKFGGGVCGIHDAFDVFRLLAHGGDTSAAVRDAAARLGIDRKPKTNRGRGDGDVIRAIDAGGDADEFKRLWSGGAGDDRLRAMLAAHGAGAGQADRLLALARSKREGRAT